MKRIMLFLVLFLAVYQTAQANGIFFDHEGACADRVRERLRVVEADCIQSYRRKGFLPGVCLITEEEIQEDIHYNCVHDDNCVHLEKTEKESE